MNKIFWLLATPLFVSATTLNARWQVETKTDPVTSNTNALARLMADGGTLQFMCTEGKGWALIFVPKEDLGKTSWVMFGSAATNCQQSKANGNTKAMQL